MLNGAGGRQEKIASGRVLVAVSLVKVSEYWMQNTTKTTVGLGFRGMWQSHGRWFLPLAAAGLGLRMLFVLRFPVITPDGIVYADLAKNWLLHGVYGMSGTAPAPTLIRLPGYPAFLAVLFAISGIDHYNAVRFTQVIFDLGTCFVTADLARRAVMGRLPPDGVERVTRWAFALAALCPFLANYTAPLLTETLAIFLASMALDLGIEALRREDAGEKSFRWWTGCGLAIAAGIYLRPDGGTVLIAIGGYVLYRFVRSPESRVARRESGELCSGRGTRDSVLTRTRTFWAGVILGIFSLGPLAPWTIRNWRDFHRFEPLAPTHATEVGEFYAKGFDQWQRTWLVDYSSLEDISFRVDGEPVAFDKLPKRAFDDEDQHRATEALIADYNATLRVTPALDARFEQLAQERIRRHPLRYYAELPLARALDLWLRPRTEMLPIDVHWWRFREDPADSAWAMFLGLVNLGYIVLAIIGLRRVRVLRYAALLLAFVIVRTVVITAITFPEPRYVLECYPVVIVFAAVAAAASLSPVVSRQAHSI